MPASENQIVVYQPNETVRLDGRVENETVWLNRQQMAQLFGRDVKTIGKHIANALSEELAESPLVANLATTQSQRNPTVAKSAIVATYSNSVVAKFATTATDGKVYQVEYYNLDVVLSVGYRVKSAQGILFRRWANMVLRNYLLRGYSVNSRLNQLEDKVDRRLAKVHRRVAKVSRQEVFRLHQGGCRRDSTNHEGYVRSLGYRHIGNWQHSPLRRPGARAILSFVTPH